MIYIPKNTEELDKKLNELEKQLESGKISLEEFTNKHKEVTEAFDKKYAKEGADE